MTLLPSPLTVVRRSFETLRAPPSPMVLEVPVPHDPQTMELRLLATHLLRLSRRFSGQMWRGVIGHVRAKES